MTMTAQQAFEARNANDTMSYQNELLCRGRAGQLAFGLFRAQKRSTVAKSYRRGSHRANSYSGKQEALVYLDAVLAKWGDAMKIGWGWQTDAVQEYHNQVFYVQLKDGRQASFHTNKRASDKVFDGQWDHGGSLTTVLWYCDAVMNRVERREGLGSIDIMPFGKHVGKPLLELQPFYVEWLNNWDGISSWTCMENFLSGSEDGEPVNESGLDAELDAVLARN